MFLIYYNYIHHTVECYNPSKGLERHIFSLNLATVPTLKAGVAIPAVQDCTDKTLYSQQNLAYLQTDG